MITIPMQGAFRSLIGKRLVFRVDPVFGGQGWCIQTGSVVSEMQTMGWVSECVSQPGTIGQTGVVDDQNLVIDREGQ